MNEQMIEGTNAIAKWHIDVLKLLEVSYDVTSWWPSGILLSEDWNSAEQWSKSRTCRRRIARNSEGDNALVRVIYFSLKELKVFGLPGAAFSRAAISRASRRISIAI
jgi:hypothetical protein